MRPKRSAGMVAMLAALLLIPTAPGHAAVASAEEGRMAAAQPALRADWQSRMLDRVNAIRGRAGAPPVRLCAALTGSAQEYARDMARANRISHTGPDGSTAFQRVVGSGYRAALVGENLGAGQLSVADVMGDWRRSPTHDATMTDPRFRHVGFGYVRDRSGPYASYWVQHFGVGGACS